MFERRLKVFLIILLVFMALLGMRAVHLQVMTRASWVKEAEDFAKRAVLTETTRGRILDHNGLDMAVDQACMDACVDYRAISRDPKWIDSIAAARLVQRLGDDYKKAPKKGRQAMVDLEAQQVNKDISAMWLLLAKESGQTPEQIEEICHNIDLKVAMRSRTVQYKRYIKADKAHDQKGATRWYRRWLVEGSGDGPQVDDFEQQYAEEFEVHPILKDISPDVYMRLGKAAGHCPGLVLRAGTHRIYPQGRAGAQLLGHLSPVTRQDIDADPNLDSANPDADLRAYQFTDLIGRGGLEGLCEPALRGTRGKVLRRSGLDDEVLSQPVPGTDVRSTIDIALQGEIQQMFAQCEVPNNRDRNLPALTVPMHGAAVVIDVPSGQVRALASYPDYDPNQFNDDYEALAGDADNAPLMNRATQSMVEPGSTVKPVVGLGGITQGVIGVHEGIECTGFLVLHGHRYPRGRCWVASEYLPLLGIEGVKHHQVPPEDPHRGRFGNPDGFLVFSDALQRSCNVYFETVADRLGIDRLCYWMDHMGLGRETGIGISESCGSIPNHLDMHGQLGMYTTWFSGIGQVGVRATPIQMANVAATIARDGIWMRPRLVETTGIPLAPVKPRDGRTIPDVVDLKLDKQALAEARDGMTRVVNTVGGTGTIAHMDNLLVAGKTGTAQAAAIWDPVLDAQGNPQLNDKGKPMLRKRVAATAEVQTNTPWYRGWGPDGSDLNHAWFIGFAPADHPQIAIAVMVQYGGSGGLTAGKIARRIFQRCIDRGYLKATVKQGGSVAVGQ